MAARRRTAAHEPEPEEIDDSLDEAEVEPEMPEPEPAPKAKKVGADEGGTVTIKLAARRGIKLGGRQYGPGEEVTIPASLYAENKGLGEVV